MPKKRSASGAVARPKPVQRSRRGNLPVAGKLPAMTFTIRSRAKSALRNADLKPPDCEPVALLSIGDDRCHWPIDDGHGLDLLMCASKTDGTSTYWQLSPSHLVGAFCGGECAAPPRATPRTARQAAGSDVRLAGDTKRLAALYFGLRGVKNGGSGIAFGFGTSRIRRFSSASCRRLTQPARSAGNFSTSGTLPSSPPPSWRDG